MQLSNPTHEMKQADESLVKVRVLRNDGAKHVIVERCSADKLWTHSVRACNNDTLSKMVIDRSDMAGYTQSLLLHANPHIQSANGKLKALTTVYLPPVHLVREADETWESIADMYHISVTALLELNRDVSDFPLRPSSALPSPGAAVEQSRVLLPDYRPPGPRPALPKLPAEHEQVISAAVHACPRTRALPLIGRVCARLAGGKDTRAIGGGSCILQPWLSDMVTTSRRCVDLRRV